MNIPRIDGVEPERLLAIIEAIQQQREPAAIKKSDALVANSNAGVSDTTGVFAQNQAASEAYLPALGRHVNIWA